MGVTAIKSLQISTHEKMNTLRTIVRKKSVPQEISGEDRQALLDRLKAKYDSLEISTFDLTGEDAQLDRIGIEFNLKQRINGTVLPSQERLNALICTVGYAVNMYYHPESEGAPQ